MCIGRLAFRLQIRIVIDPITVVVQSDWLCVQLLLYVLLSFYCSLYSDRWSRWFSLPVEL